MTFSTAFEAGEVSSLAPVPIHLPTVLAQVVDAVNVVEQKAVEKVRSSIIPKIDSKNK